MSSPAGPVAVSVSEAEKNTVQDSGESRKGHPDRVSHPHGHFHEHDSVPKPGTILTVRATSGLSGDMMLSGLASIAELSEDQLEALVAELAVDSLKGTLKLESRLVNGIEGVGCSISLPHEHAHRSFSDISRIVQKSSMPPEAKRLSLNAFELLAEAEASVHGKSREEVTFHEVGALDSILDTCMVCRIFTLINPVRFVCSPLPLADGVISCAHGRIPSPAPAVLRLLLGVPVCGFAGQGETVTPTALSLLKALGAQFGPWPEMVVSRTVISYGGKVFPDAPNGALWAIGAGA